MSDTTSVAIIGGSGLYNLPGLTSLTEFNPDTPFGRASAPIVVGTFGGKRLAFLARHGLGHQINPSAVNYRANIYALKSLGINTIISISACGSLREDIAPGDVVIPDQLFDHTHTRIRSFFDADLVAHISVADPYCHRLSNHLVHAVSAINPGKLHIGGTLITIEGPRFSTRAESRLFRSWGMSIIGMTTSPEAFLAREAEICYAVMAHVTDYDSWHIEETPVNVDMVLKVLNKNTSLAQEMITNLVATLPDDPDCSCRNALQNAIITQGNYILDSTRRNLDAIIGKYHK